MNLVLQKLEGKLEKSGSIFGKRLSKYRCPLTGRDGVKSYGEKSGGDGFFLRRKKADYHSVFPPTTVAATTSIRSGLQPCEHSWLGWDCYFPQINKNVTVFTNTETGTSTPAADYHVAQKYCGYETVVEKINRHGGQAYEVMPFEEPFPQTMEAEL